MSSLIYRLRHIEIICPTSTSRWMVSSRFWGSQSLIQSDPNVQSTKSSFQQKWKKSRQTIYIHMDFLPHIFRPEPLMQFVQCPTNTLTILIHTFQQRRQATSKIYLSPGISQGKIPQEWTLKLKLVSLAYCKILLGLRTTESSICYDRFDSWVLTTAWGLPQGRGLYKEEDCKCKDKKGCSTILFPVNAVD